MNNAAPSQNGSRRMITWLLRRTIARAPSRLILEAIAVAFPVAMLAATLWYVDAAVQQMTPNALSSVQVEMRAVAKSLDANIVDVSKKLATTPEVKMAEPFAAAKVLIQSGDSGQMTARLFAVNPEYLKQHPWIKTVSGSLDQGAMLSQSARVTPGFETAKSITITLPGDAPEFSLEMPVGGVADLREATTWFSIPYGEVQGDIVTVPRAIIIDFKTYEQKLLPVLREWAKAGGLPPFDPGSSELPSANLESHITINHDAYPPDPGQAQLWSSKLQRVLGRQAGLSVVVADNAAEALFESREDSVNAKMLFLLLGIPGVLVAGALGLTGVSALVESYRREEALLRMRGATNGQITWLATAQAAVAGFAGAALGLAVASLAVCAATGKPVWHGVPPDSFLLSAGLAVAAGITCCFIRVAGLRRASRLGDISERRLLNPRWLPVWRSARLDVIFTIIGIAILAINIWAGALKRSPIQGPALMLSFYVLLAPLALWLGATLLLTRGMLAGLGSWADPKRKRPLTSWWGTALRWLGRRPSHMGRALITGALAVAFGVQVLSFAATYRTAKQADAVASMGSDLRVTPVDPRFPLPSLGPDIASVSPIRLVPSRVDTDRKSILALDLKSYPATATSQPRMLDGVGLAGLVENPNGVLIHTELATDFELTVGDKLEVTIFPDDFGNTKDMQIPILGIYSAFPPNYPISEIVTSVDALPRAALSPPDYYLAKLAPGHQAKDVAMNLGAGPLAQKFVVTATTAPNERGLTALSLGGLSLIESIGAGLVSAIGVAVMGAFLVIERRREFAILRAVGADTRHILTGPALEGAAVVLGSLIFGIPIGLGLGVLAIQVLGLFFALQPPLLTVPTGGLLALVLFVMAASTFALGIALASVNRIQPASVLRTP
jgi:putative ABC transport system permease protein